MIKLNGKQITPTIFPDGTSQVWQLDFQDNGFHVVEWEFENEAEFIHVAQLADLLHNTGAAVNLVMPYLPYGRQDKEISNDSTFALKTFIGLLQMCEFETITTIDDHSDVAQKAFRNMCKNYKNIYPEKEINKALDLSKPDFAAYPDRGAETRYREKTKLPFTVGSKVRDAKTGYILKYNITANSNYQLSHFKDKKVLMIDDICDGGMTFILLTKELLEKGVKSVDLYVTHGIFSKGIQPLKEAGINRIFTRKGEVFPSKDTKFLIKEY